MITIFLPHRKTSEAPVWQHNDNITIELRDLHTHPTHPSRQQCSEYTAQFRQLDGELKKIYVMAMVNI